MTQYNNRCVNNGILSALCSLSLLLGALSLSLFFSDDASAAVYEAMKLCAAVIIPSVFPFMIISDFLISAVNFNSLKLPSRIFERIFHIKGDGLCAFTMGAICGFPLGVKCACELYRAGRISRAEAEKLIGFSNNTGPAFIVSGIGVGLRASAADGIFLYLVMLASAIAVGIIFPTKKGSGLIEYKFDDNRTRFDLIASVKSAALGCVYICAFLTFFAPVCALVRIISGGGYIYLLSLPFFEVGNAVKEISLSPMLTDLGSLALTGFAISFSGLSVHMQALSFIKDTDIRVGRYFLMKLAEGGTAVLLILALYPLIK